MNRPFRIGSLVFAVILCPTVAASVIFQDPAGVGLDMAIDKAGNVYFAGAPNSDPNSTYPDVTVKYDNKGNKLWEQAYQGPAADGWGMSTAIAADDHGNAYVTGHTMLRQRKYESDDTIFGYMTVKYDAKGKQLWRAIYREPQKVLTSADAIALDNAGNVYVVAASYLPDTRLDPNDPNKVEYIADWEPDSDIVIMKYNTNGKQLWAIRYGDDPNHDAALYNLTVDRHGSVYITGSSTIDRGINGTDLYGTTIKYNTRGKQQWVANIGGDPNTIMASSALALDSKANAYVAASSKPLGAADHSDFLTIKYDMNGKQQWLARHRITGKMSSHSSAIAVGSAGNVYMTGWICPKPDLSLPSRYPPADFISRMNKSQVVTLKYDANGKHLWVATYKEPERGVFPRDLIIDVSGNIYVIGKDALVIKYDAHGNQQWARWFKNAAELAKFLGSLKR